MNVDMSQTKYLRIMYVLEHMDEVEEVVKQNRLKSPNPTFTEIKYPKQVAIAKLAGVTAHEVQDAKYIMFNGTEKDIEFARLGFNLRKLHAEIKGRNDGTKVQEPVAPVVAPVIPLDEGLFGIDDFSHELGLKNNEILNGFKRALRVHNDLDKEKSKSVVLQHIDLLIHQLTVFKGELQ